MLKVNYEFRKGILFIRLNGYLTVETASRVKEEVIDMIIDNGIKNVVFNLSDISVVDEVGIKNLQVNFELCQKSCSNVLLCGLKERFNVVFHKEHLVENELNAFEKITI